MINIEYLRSFRVGGFAIFDIGISFLGIYLLSPILARVFRFMHLDIPLMSWFYLTLPIGILAHLVVGTDTLMLQQFLDPRGHFLLKFSLITLAVLGIKQIKIIN